MNAAASLSKAIRCSRRAFPNNIPRQCNSAAAHGRSFSSPGAAASPARANPRAPLLSSRRQVPRPTSLPHPSAAFQRRSLFIQIATTPNPESIKFIPNNRLVLGHGSEGADGDAAESDGGGDDGGTNGVYLTRNDHTLVARSPLVKSLFNLDVGIKSVYLGRDFLTVTKYAEAHWSHLQTPIFGAIMDFYATGEPALRDVPEITDTTILDDDDEIVAMIKELLETRIRPAVQEDGGDIRYVGFEEGTGIVTVRLAGSCVGCPSSSVTLKNGVENMLMHYIPEVTSVVSLEDEEEDDGAREGGGDGADDADEVKVEQSSEEKKKMKTYQDRLAAAGIPFSD